MNSKFFFPALPGQFPNGDGYFGAFGGKFIPEALVAAVDEVATEYERGRTVGVIVISSVRYRSIASAECAVIGVQEKFSAGAWLVAVECRTRPS